MEEEKVNCNKAMFYFFHSVYKIQYQTYRLYPINGIMQWTMLHVHVFVLYRQEKSIPAPFPFEDKQLGQTKCTFRRNINMVHTIQQNPLAFVPGKMGQENVKFKNSVA